MATNNTGDLSKVQPDNSSVSNPDVQKVGSVVSGDIKKATAYVAVATSVLIAGKAFYENDKMFSKKNKKKKKTKEKVADLKKKFKDFKNLTFSEKLKIAKDFFLKNKGIIIGLLSPIVASKVTEVISSSGGLFKSYEDLIKLIDEAKSPEDVVPLKARVSSARNRLTNIESNLQKIVNLLDTIASYAEVVGLIIAGLEVLLVGLKAFVKASSVSPIVPGAVTGTLAVINDIEKVLAKLLEISAKLLLLIGITLPLLEMFLAKIKALKAKLDLIDETIENPENLSRAIESGQIDSLVVKVGYLEGFDYKGYRFYIKEDPDPKFEISGYKRHYAVAVDTDGVEAYKSKLSYTTDPNVLVEELKLKIDNNNLKI